MGTEDDEDEPEDEHPGENEAGVRETNKVAETAEAFEKGAEDGRHVGIAASRILAPR